MDGSASRLLLFWTEIGFSIFSLGDNFSVGTLGVSNGITNSLSYEVLSTGITKAPCKPSSAGMPGKLDF
jgi:hypothetical protein|tara:strand:- start:556 stop:762 length:207 start_codon:yes stop_codon:yes gene_type:complete